MLVGEDMGKKITSIRIDEEVLKKAQEVGLNVSKVSENALKEAIRRLDGSSGGYNRGTVVESSPLKEVKLLKPQSAYQPRGVVVNPSGLWSPRPRFESGRGYLLI